MTTNSREYMRAYQRHNRANKRAWGLCLDCTAFAEPGRRYCRPCLDRYNARVKAAKQRRRAALSG